MRPAFATRPTFVAFVIPLLLALTPPGASAQDAAAAPDSAAAKPPYRAPRASWTSDRLGLKVGDLITVVVDEQTAARERVSRVATGNRSQKNSLRANMNQTQNAYDFNFGSDADSHDVGEAGRAGDLTAVLTVRVTAIEENGVARIAGAKTVDVDGRAQEIALKGVIRPHDVSPGNTVLSSRIAEAVITYKGKKIGPRTGIIGKILGMLWP